MNLSNPYQTGKLIAGSPHQAYFDNIRGLLPSFVRPVPLTSYPDLDNLINLTERVITGAREHSWGSTCQTQDVKSIRQELEILVGSEGLPDRLRAAILEPLLAIKEYCDLSDSYDRIGTDRSASKLSAHGMDETLDALHENLRSREETIPAVLSNFLDKLRDIGMGKNS